MAIGSQFFLTLRRALLALRSDSSFSPILVKTKKLIQRAEEDNIIIDLCLVPGHVNVRGNEKADAAAKDAALRALTAAPPQISQSLFLDAFYIHKRSRPITLGGSSGIAVCSRFGSCRVQGRGAPL